MSRSNDRATDLRLKEKPNAKAFGFSFAQVEVGLQLRGIDVALT
jgi:hypothetical protein